MLKWILNSLGYVGLDCATQDRIGKVESSLRCIWLPKWRKVL